jgi:hypothetical protein
MKNYVVCWASGWQDDRGNTEVNSGINGIYDSLDKAKAGLEEAKQLHLEELMEPFIEEDAYDSEEERQEAINNLEIEVYGSVDDGYFEITYYSWDSKNAIHISIRDDKVQ